MCTEVNTWYNQAKQSTFCVTKNNAKQINNEPGKKTVKMLSVDFKVIWNFFAVVYIF